ncbi:hypothetical protein BDB00DRAFT_854993 [Zychaea mexicana]|uniref:uncharacterized protein n=1 Tax=Zychaea mexicana TaxID=64656 RepID=UPI0022FDF495|nr:uncharacterized protein BDB00DRAFT_854993 [Zychaea mexicana]KAI9484547.1 hypothetical protein BDB00DRAFT_854993 [Zychaea mexicana]
MNITQYSDDNATRLVKKIEQLGAFNVCYENDPRRPVLANLFVIRNDSFTFKRYLTALVSFLNEAFRPYVEPQNACYSLENITMKDVYMSVIPKNQYLNGKLEKQKLSIIGYTRKSPGCESNENRKTLLNHMVKCLQERSLCDKIFVSPYSVADEPLTSRDMNESNDLSNGLECVFRNTQAMISYIQSSEKNVCLVAIDFSRLSINTNDLTTFIENHENLKTIIIDTLPYKHKVHVFERHSVLENPSLLNAFNCRSKPIQRFKDV